MIRASSVPVGASAVRPVWTDLPEPVRREIEQFAGAAVTAAESQGSGFTPGFASRLRLANDRWIFVKAASSEYPWMVEAYQAEVDKLRVLPAAVPAPRVIFSRRFEVDGSDWLVTGFEDVAGHSPSRPWRLIEATEVVDRVTAMGHALTPPPDGVDWLDLDAEFAENPDHWDLAIERELVPEELVGIGPTLARDFLDRYQRTTLTHGDLRDDNVIIGDEVWICDWNFPALGPIWTDVVSLLISMHGDGLDANRLLARTGLVPREEQALVDGYLATLLGYFTFAGQRPEVDNSPYLRTHQRWYADATADWLRQRVG